MSLSLDRRRLIAGTAAVALAGPARLFAAPATDARLLVVFMRGAYDCLSATVPLGSSIYAASRPNIAVSREATLPLDGDWGLAKSLAPLAPYWQRGQLAFVPFAGTTDRSRSHFHSQDTLEYGLGGDAAGSGFLNRLVVELGGRAHPLAFTTQLPIILRGPAPVANLVIGKTAAAPATRRDDMLARMYAGDRQLGTQVAQDYAARREVSAALATEMATAGKSAPAVNNFEATARRIATVMRGEANLGFVDVGGWDTHVNQAGQLDFKLGQLAAGLAGFADGIGPQLWPRTTVVVVSEFGRTLRENGGRGTDHGRGTSFWVMGGGIKGRRIAGRQVRIERATLNEDRDLPVLNDWRGVFGGLFARLYGLDAPRLGRVFPGAKPADLGLI